MEHINAPGFGEITRIRKHATYMRRANGLNNLFYCVLVGVSIITFFRVCAKITEMIG